MPELASIVHATQGQRDPVQPQTLVKVSCESLHNGHAEGQRIISPAKCAHPMSAEVET